MRMVLTHFRPVIAYDTLFPDSDIKIQDDRADLIIDLNLDGSSQVEADIDLSMPQLAVIRGDETAAIQNSELKGKIHINHDLAMVSLSELVLDSPRMQLTGRLISSFNEPQLRMQLEGRDIDLETTRQAAPAMFGNHEFTRRIFEIVKRGTVPVITIEAQGASLSDLGKVDNLVIQGQLRDGGIYAPKAALNLEKTSGDILISNGVLTAKHIKAAVGKSSLQNGRLTLGLTGNTRAFQLVADVQADLAELPPILKRMVDHQGFQKELSLLKAVKGKANGKLVLGEDLKNVKMRVEASDIDLFARYRRIPFPIEITQGNTAVRLNFPECQLTN
jgi:hypothetical protein